MTKKVTIIGATGSIGRTVTEYLLENSNDEMVLFARSANHIKIEDPSRETAMAGDVRNVAELDAAIAGSDAVFAALSGDLASMARDIVASMDRTGVKRLIFISSMGIYNEIPAWGADGNLEYNPMLSTYREAADMIEASDLDYTVIRPGWFTSGPVDYEVTRKGEPFGGHDVSRKSIADLVMKLIADPALYAHDSVGINTPNS
ncbi:NAD(P)H-binding protein [Anaerotardibacter muris]|uniref:NAD(P)H-binding protein n=1 Tax=Anaerotardibacter muris TaxID=2941505 RepID=UPI00203B1B02|nr:NAD(P)H-binding protein [Anaerotardibacter muris]